MKANGESLLNAHKAFSKGVNSELQHAFGMFDQNMQDIIDHLTQVINGVHDAVQDMPAIMDDAAKQYADQTAQLVRYMERTSAMLEDAARHVSAGRGGGQ